MVGYFTVPLILTGKYRGSLSEFSKYTGVIFTPHVGGVGVVDKGFWEVIGASVGCGGGVARTRSSCR